MVLTNFKHFRGFSSSSLLMLVRVMQYRAWVSYIPILRYSYTLTHTYILIYLVRTDLSSPIVKGTENSGGDGKSDGDRKLRHTYGRTNSLNLLAI